MLYITQKDGERNQQFIILRGMTLSRGQKVTKNQTKVAQHTFNNGKSPM